LPRFRGGYRVQNCFNRLSMYLDHVAGVAGAMQRFTRLKSAVDTSEDSHTTAIDGLRCARRVCIPESSVFFAMAVFLFHLIRTSFCCSSFGAERS
jgi:hypothetical protein